MARYDKSRPKRPKQNAAVAPARPRASTAPSIEDTMFFPRLRRHAKWMFVLLAVFMGLGFVLFGVGAGGVGVGDVFRGSGGTTQSISDAQDELAEAIAALDTAVQLDPKDPTTFRQLAGLRLALATRRQQDAQLLQAVAVYRAPSQLFPGFLGAGGQPVMQDQLANAVAGSVSGRVTVALQDASANAAQAVAAYKRLVALQPNDPNVQLELAQAAQQTGDAATAIAAYERFLKLAPDDPSATIVQEQLKQLKQSVAAGAG
jgi:tetratricopeptide (TPR) repeat protein